MVLAENLVKRYGTTQAVKDVGFSIGRGEIVGLLGPNGAGKTTLMKILTCYHFPDFGSVRIGSWNVHDNPQQIKQMIGYLPENAPVYSDLNVYEYLDFISDARKIAKEKKEVEMERVIEICGLKDVVFKPIDQLSKGFRQRVGLAQAIIHDPELLILDEPTTGLDPNQIIEIRKLIQELGKKKTVILSTHILREVEAVCSRVMIMNKGSIVASGTPDEISGQMKGGAVISLKVTGDKFQALQDDIENLDCIEKIVSDDKKALEVNRIQVSVTDKARASEEIFDLVVKHGMRIQEIYPVEMSLEDIFIQLTGKEGGNNE